MTTYTFTAYQEADLLGNGSGSNISQGVVFTVPGTASVSFEVTDNDAYMSGDSGDNATDSSGQTASITDASGTEVGNGGQIYGEQYHWVYDQQGHWYLMIEIEQEGDGQDYFAFHTAYGVPAPGTQLTVSCAGNIGCWQPSYDCLDGGEAPLSISAVNDAITVMESEGAGDIETLESGETSILANDSLNDQPYAGSVVTVDGSSASVGDWIDLPKGRIKINADGTVDFDANGDFASLDDGDSETLNVSYSIENGSVSANATVTITVLGQDMTTTIDADEDYITVFESEGAGDLETLDSGATTVLANDTVNGQAYTGSVVEVNGVSGNVGQWIDLPKGRILINADGTVDFDANGDFDNLNSGEEEIVEVNYTIATQGEVTSAVGPNLIVNGGFEHNSLNNSGGSWNVLQSGWYDIGSGRVNIHEQNYGHGNATGDAIAELECGVILCQNVQVDDAGTYEFSFDITRRGHSDQDNTFELYIDGVRYDTYTANGPETISITLDLTSGSHRFDFKSLSHTYIGAGLDDVELRNVTTGSSEVTAHGPVIIKVLGEDGIATIDADEDYITVFESEGAGDLETLDSGATTVLANDTVDGQPYAGAVVEVNGVAGNVGQWVTLTKGRVMINADGTVDFDAEGDFDSLNAGEEETVEVNYTILASGGGATLSAQGPVFIRVLGEQDGCTIDVIDDNYSVGETQDISDNILTNDLFNDMAATTGDITVVNVAAAGTTVAANAAVGTSFDVTTDGGRQGTVTVNSDGTFTFDGGNNFVDLDTGETDTFQLSYTGRAMCEETQKHNLLFVLDISNSTVNGNGTQQDTFNGENVADLNGDGLDNTVLDAQIQGVLSAIQNLIDQGVDPSLIDVGLVTFSGQASGYATVDAETLGTWALDSAALTAALTGIQSGGWTNYEAGLQQAESWLAGQQGDGASNQVYFLSDGRPAIGTDSNGNYIYQNSSNYGDEVAAIANTYNADIHAIGVGANSDLQYLNELDNTNGAEQVLDLTELTASLVTNTNFFIEDTATITVTVNGEGTANIPPDARDNDYVLAMDVETYVGNFITDVDAVDGVDSDADNDPLELISINGTNLSGATKTVAVTTAAGKTGQVQVSASGDFTFALDAGQSIDPGTTDTVSGTYSISDGNGGTDTANYSFDLSADVGSGGPAIFNVVFVVDVSGSMYSDQGAVTFPMTDYNGDGRANQAIDLVHYGLEDYLTEIADYELANPNTTINLSFIGFSVQADAAVTLDASSATAIDDAFAGLSSSVAEGGATNYRKGLLEADAWFASVADAGETNIVYFLSDGDPEPENYEAAAIALETDYQAEINASFIGPGSAGTPAAFAPLDLVDSGSRAGEQYPADLSNNEVAIDNNLDTMVFNLG